MMVRTQIMLDSEHHRIAKQKAAEQGISLAEYLRRAIAREVDQPEPTKGDISLIFDLGSSDQPTNVAKDKDKMIGDAALHNYLRKMGRIPKD